MDGCNLSDPFRAGRRGTRSLEALRRNKRRFSVWLNPFHGGNETAAAARKRLDKAGLLVRIAECAAESLNRCVHAMLEIDEGVGGPKALLQFFSGQEFARMFQQQRENLEGPASETDFATVLAEFAGAKIDMVVIETKPAFVRKLVGHWETCEMECNARAGATQNSAANMV